MQQIKEICGVDNLRGDTIRRRFSSLYSHRRVVDGNDDNGGGGDNGDDDDHNYDHDDYDRDHDDHVYKLNIMII